MSRPVAVLRSCNSLLVGACAALAVAGCGSDNHGGQNGAAGPLGIAGTIAATGGATASIGGAPAAGGAAAGGAAMGNASGGASVGSGGSAVSSGGAVTSTGSGGQPTTSAGGTTGVGGTTGAAAGGGSAAGGSGGAAGAGAGGSTSSGGASGAAGTAGVAGAGGMTFGHCDSRTQTAEQPLLTACGDIIGPDGVDLKLGPYGAIMDRNVGKGFENTDPMDNGTCPGFAALFAEAQSVTSQLLDVGTQPCNATAPNTGTCVDFKLYTVYRPAVWPSGQIPVISWANGTCAQPEGYGTLLRYVASFGFFVVAANSREVGTGKEPLHALDYAAAANSDSMSPYYGHLDMTKVGVMGHSQGGQATVAAASDMRVDDVIIFNGGLSAVKPFLSVSGDMDVTGYTAAQMAASVNAAPKGAYLYYHNPSGAPTDNLKGHLVLMLTPGRVTTPTVAWWQMVFGTDPNAENQFVGASCGLCSSPSDYAFGEHGL